jgi:hypothetical protein
MSPPSFRVEESAEEETSVKAGGKHSFSTLQTEATCSPETSVDFQRTTRRYIREDRNLGKDGRRRGYVGRNRRGKGLATRLAFGKRGSTRCVNNHIMYVLLNY